MGGRTVAEAQQSMSYAEFCRWLAYRRKRGSLHPGLRGDRQAALLAMLYINAHKKKGSQATKLHDLLPHEEEPPISMEEAMKTWH
ncbi:MAG: phage tail assembly protein T [Pseudomonadota bacterium]